MTTRAKGGAATAPPPPLFAAADPASAAALREVLPVLSPVDIFRGVVPLTFGEHRYELAALSVAEDEAWIASLDTSLRSLLEGVRQGEDDTTAVMAVLMTTTDRWLDAVIAYDRDGVLPDKAELRRQGRAVDALRAALTIWVATNPTLAVALSVQATAAGTNGKSPVATSSSPRRTAGRRARRGRS